MKIIEIYYEQYKIPLNQEFTNSKNRYTVQQGLFLTIKTKKYTGKGEAILLKGFTNNTLQEIIWSMESFISSIEINEEYSLEELLMLVKIHCIETPTVQFAIDTAIYDITSQKNNISLARFFNKKSSDYVDCSQTLVSRNMTIINDTVKIKVGIESIDDDINFLKYFSQYNPLVKIRLDANQLYSIEEFDSFYSQITKLNIDFFEEPIKNPNLKKIEHIKNLFPNLNYAIDESIYQNTNYKEWITKNLISTIVIRPSILGSYKQFFKMTNLYSKNLKIVISSSLENSIANMATIHLASTLQKQVKHGLNIHSFYKNFLLPPTYKNDKIKLNNIIGLGL